jgi:hypothetical protein
VTAPTPMDPPSRMAQTLDRRWGIWWQNRQNHRAGSSNGSGVALGLASYGLYCLAWACHHAG